MEENWVRRVALITALKEDVIIDVPYVQDYDILDTKPKMPLDKGSVDGRADPMSLMSKEPMHYLSRLA